MSGMKSIFSGSCPKDLSSPESNEDQFFFCLDSRRIAMCDGASESYDSKLWADILSKKYVDDPGVTAAWVEAAVIDYESRNDPDSLSWSKQAAYERGSFATLLGIEYDQGHGTVGVLAIGDSLAILFDTEEKKMIDVWPFNDPERFKEHPTLLSTLREHNAFVGKSRFWNMQSKNFELKNIARPFLLCMTDALGEWALKDELSGGTGLTKLVAMSSEEELAALVIEERAAKRMRIDDSTLLTFSFDYGENGNGLPLL